jgi:hypothetical protein
MSSQLSGVKVDTTQNYINIIVRSSYSVKEAVEIDMNTVSIGGVKQNVLAMSVSQAKYIAHH